MDAIASDCILVAPDNPAAGLKSNLLVLGNLYTVPHRLLLSETHDSGTI